MWVDAFHPGFKTHGEVSQLVADARAGGFNTLFVEVRKRGDAYYNSHWEPKAEDLAPGYDPLADLVAQAHDTQGGPYLEVHAWMVTYNIWGQRTNPPAQLNHPYRLHPGWLTKNIPGETWDAGGNSYAFDPGHPDAQRHTFEVAMDLVANYDVDGLNLDYVRYGGTAWGYNDAAVARFNQRYGRTGLPASYNAAWLQFRRDQVSALVRKVYLSAVALKPWVKISADTITWAPGVTTDAGWTNAANAYNAVLQDWRAWMAEGILDLNLPMAYFRQHTANASDWAAWCRFAKDHRYDRQVAIGVGMYLNTLSNVLYQMRDTRAPTPSGHAADGVVGYSYAVPTGDGTSRERFLAALTDPSGAECCEPNARPLFGTPAVAPVMPWKTAPTRGHLKGFVTRGQATNWVEGIAVTLTGAATRSRESDATGFYGFVDLAPGNYIVTAGTASSNVVVTAGQVTTADLLLAEAPEGISLKIERFFY